MSEIIRPGQTRAEHKREQALEAQAKAQAEMKAKDVQNFKDTVEFQVNNLATMAEIMGKRGDVMEFNANLQGTGSISVKFKAKEVEISTDIEKQIKEETAKAMSALEERQKYGSS